MRVLITTPVHPPDLGGPATFVPLFARHLIANGHQVDVLTYADREARDLDLPYRLITVRRTWLPLRYLSFFGRTVVAAAGVDVVLACEHPRATTVAAARLLRRRVVVRVMVDTAWELSFRRRLTRETPEAFRARPRRGRERIFQAMQRFSLRRADLVVTVSEHLAAMARGMGAAPERVFVSKNLPAESTRALRGPAESGTVFRLLVVARLVEWKRVGDVLDALEALDDSYRLKIVGDGPLRSALAARIDASSALRERVEMLGAVDSKAVRTAMEESDLLLLCSVYEGLSHVVLEAFAAGLPVVASAIPGNRELVGDDEAGRLVPPEDVDALVRTVEALRVAPELRARLARRASRRLEAWRGEHSLVRLEQRLVRLCEEGSC